VSADFELVPPGPVNEWEHKDDPAHAREILEHAVDRPNAGVFCLLSGGHDSMSVCDFAIRTLGTRIDGIAHCNTGIGIPETRDYVREQSERLDRPLLEYKAAENVDSKGRPDPQVYRDLVTWLGFPGAAGHNMMVGRLKERSMRRIARDVGATPRRPVIFISGCRKEESTRRLGTTDELQQRGRTTWTAPFAWWTKRQCHRYMAERGIPHNPVVDNLCMSGECLCGAFCSGIGERREIEFHYPHVAAEIDSIERDVIAAGHPYRWHESVPKWYSKWQIDQEAGQQDAFEYERDEVLLTAGFNPLCTRCVGQAEDQGLLLPDEHTHSTDME